MSSFDRGQTVTLPDIASNFTVTRKPWEQTAGEAIIRALVKNDASADELIEAINQVNPFESDISLYELNVDLALSIDTVGLYQESWLAGSKAVIPRLESAKRRERTGILRALDYVDLGVGFLISDKKRGQYIF
ncbi:MAG: hypothetical protein ACFBZ9_10175 [Sphingomonadales bacterium]